jgi:hypothetical protein
MSLEGVAGTPFDPADAAEASITVRATSAEVTAALASPPDFDTDLPAFLSLGFNRPVGSTGTGIAVGDTRVIEFTGGSHDDHPVRLLGLVGGDEHRHHDRSHMWLRVTESGPGRVVFTIEGDDTMVARWADLHRAVVTWAASGAGETRVTWRLEYRRLLAPAAYFGPLQRFAAGQASRYLLDATVGGLG